MKALVVDDEESIRVLLCDILESIGWEAEQAQDCLEAWQKMESGAEFDLTLIDWRTPNMTGLELVEKMKESEKYSNIKLVMITGLNDMKDVEAALVAGADEYLMKPFTKDMVFDKLRIVGFDAN